MNRPPRFNREGLLALLIYSGIAIAQGVACGSLAALAWGLWPGVITAGIVSGIVVLLLCSLYTGSPGE